MKQETKREPSQQMLMTLATSVDLVSKNVYSTKLGTVKELD